MTTQVTLTFLTRHKDCGCGWCANLIRNKLDGNKFVLWNMLYLRNGRIWGTMTLDKFKELCPLPKQVSREIKRTTRGKICSVIKYEKFNYWKSKEQQYIDVPISEEFRKFLNERRKYLVQIIKRSERLLRSVKKTTRARKVGKTYWVKGTNERKYEIQPNWNNVDCDDYQPLVTLWKKYNRGYQQCGRICIVPNFEISQLPEGATLPCDEMAKRILALKNDAVMMDEELIDTIAEVEQEYEDYNMGRDGEDGEDYG